MTATGGGIAAAVPIAFSGEIEPGVNRLNYTQGEYRTDPGEASAGAGVFPDAVFYGRLLTVVWKAGRKAGRGCYSDREWSRSSLEILTALERAGMRIHITGVEHIAKLTSPCVIIGNHMSVLETVVLPGIIQPFRNVTFVIKKSLMEYPVFKHVMRSRNPIVVGRANPRRDLKDVLDGGRRLLAEGVSIIVFPQTTRTLHFDPRRFNTIGVKLARKAGVPVIPLALLTDAWANGRYIKEFGRIDPARSVHFAFGPPIWVQGSADESHRSVTAFIGAHLERWQAARE